MARLNKRTNAAFSAMRNNTCFSHELQAALGILVLETVVSNMTEFVILLGIEEFQARGIIRMSNHLNEQKS